MWQKQVPQTRLASQWLQFFDDFGWYPRIARSAVGSDLVVKTFFIRVDVLIHEGDQPGLHGLDLVGVIKVHRGLRSFN